MQVEIDESGCWYELTVYGVRRTWVRSKSCRDVLGLTDLEPEKYACHHCDNPLCVNPEHLYVGDAATNGADASRRGRHVKTGRHSSHHKGPRFLTIERAAIATAMRGRGYKLSEIGEVLQCTPATVHYLLKV